MVEKITVKSRGKRLFDVNELPEHPLKVKIREIQDHLEELGHERPSLSDIVRRSVFIYYNNVMKSKKGIDQ